MSFLSDLDHLKIETVFQPDHVCSPGFFSDPRRGIRKAKVERKWYRKKSLGIGSFGEVWLEEEASDSSNLRAVKLIRKAQMVRNEIDYMRELKALALFSKPKYQQESLFVDFLGWYDDDATLYLAMEYFPLGDLNNFVQSDISEAGVREIASQVLQGLTFIHTEGYAHRDLKPGNIFVVQRSPWWVKIGDFGISKSIADANTAFRTVLGTRDYMAPELFYYVDGQDEDEDEYSNAVDVWAVGCIVFRLVAKISPFPPGPSLRKYCLNQDLFPGEKIASRSSSACETFIKRLLRPDPLQRPSATEAAKDPWIVSSPYTEDPVPAQELQNENKDSSQQVDEEETVRVRVNEQQSLQEESPSKDLDPTITIPVLPRHPLTRPGTLEEVPTTGEKRMTEFINTNTQSDTVIRLEKDVAGMATNRAHLSLSNMQPIAKVSNNQHVASPISSPNSHFSPAPGASRGRVQNGTVPFLTKSEDSSIHKVSLVEPGGKTNDAEIIEQGYPIDLGVNTSEQLVAKRSHGQKELTEDQENPVPPITTIPSGEQKSINVERTIMPPLNGASAHPGRSSQPRDRQDEKPDTTLDTKKTTDPDSYTNFLTETVVERNNHPLRRAKPSFGGQNSSGQASSQSPSRNTESDAQAESPGPKPNRRPTRGGANREQRDMEIVTETPAALTTNGKSPNIGNVRLRIRDALLGISPAEPLLYDLDDPFAPFTDIMHLAPRVGKDGWIEDDLGNKVGRVVEGEPEEMIGDWVHVRGTIVASPWSESLGRFGRLTVSGRAERWTDSMLQSYHRTGRV